MQSKFKVVNSERQHLGEKSLLPILKSQLLQLVPFPQSSRSSYFQSKQALHYGALDSFSTKSSNIVSLLQTLVLMLFTIEFNGGIATVRDILKRRKTSTIPFPYHSNILIHVYFPGSCLMHSHSKKVAELGVLYHSVFYLLAVFPTSVSSW